MFCPWPLTKLNIESKVNDKLTNSVALEYDFDCISIAVQDTFSRTAPDPDTARKTENNMNKASGCFVHATNLQKNETKIMYMIPPFFDQTKNVLVIRTTNMQ